MAKIFRTNILSLSGVDITIDPNDTSNYLRHDGAFANPIAAHSHNYVTGVSISGSYLTGLIGITGINGLQVIQSGNTIVISGASATGGTPTDTTNLTGARNTQITLNVNGGYANINTGLKTYIRSPKNFSLNSWEMVADTTGNISIDIIKTGFANYPPTNSIVNGNYPFLSGQRTNFTGSLSSWSSVNINQGDHIGLIVNAVSGLKNIYFYLYGIST
jgi:hypothetical protein